jgi:hypothetical protein
MGERRGVCKVLLWKPEGNRLLGRPSCRWEGNMKRDLQDVGWRHGLDRSGTEQGQVVGTCKCGNELSSSIKYGEFLD